MTIRMKNLEQLTLDEMEEFVKSHRHLRWSATGQKSVYGLIEGVLKAQRYGHLNKGQKGVVKGFSGKSHDTESRADHAVDPTLDANEADRAETRPAAPLPPPPPPPGCCRAGRSRSRSRRSNRPGSAQP